MDKNRTEGAVRQAKGSIKEAIGKLTGNKRVELEGTAEKTVGKVQRKAGKAADAVRGSSR
ncbi:CsbD family protein [Luteibacter sp.]|uniref:CsbD family protein n=1 Tax=Luteibacter sp. TaxID=1886636 RepID=UPI0025C52995|nr:CsbD family protein [Luteibacter sp.]